MDAWDRVQSRWRNLFPQNKTQTRYDRFIEGPGTELKTMYDGIVESYSKLGKTWGKTHWDDLLEK